MRYFLNIVYLLLLIACSPIWLYRMIAMGKYRNGLAQKILGRVPFRKSDRPCLWFHAVSVGEVIQLEGLLDGLRESHPEIDLVLSTTTSTGYAVAQKKYSDILVCYLPFDFTWSVKNALRRIRPAAFLLVELELWPNLIFETHRRNITLGLINGRVSERSFRGYRKIRPLICRLLSCFWFIATQNETYAGRLKELGSDGLQLVVTGSIKYDRIETDRQNANTEELRSLFQIEERETVWVVGSTHEPEEEYAIQTWKSLREDYPCLRLILVPRHQERFEHVARLLDQYQLRYVRRSKLTQIRKDNLQQQTKPIILLDTLGELGACWGLADIAYVGGSLCQRGGQNMIEPAAFGAALLFGPNTQNFRATVTMLLAENAAIVVSSLQELKIALMELLEDEIRVKQLGYRAQKTVLRHRGATQRTLDLIEANCLSPDLETEQIPGDIAA